MYYYAYLRLTSMINNDSIAIGIKTYIMKGEKLYYGT